MAAFLTASTMSLAQCDIEFATDRKEQLEMHKEILLGKKCFLFAYVAEGDSRDFSFSWDGCNFEMLKKGTMMFEWAKAIHDRRELENTLSIRTWERDVFVGEWKRINPAFGKKLEANFKRTDP